MLSVFLPAFVLLSALSVLWALASPIYSAPDENAHAAKAIAQVHGEVVGHDVPDVPYQVVDLPDSYRYSPGLVCFAYHPEVSADCGVELGASTGTNWFSSWVASYNPIYYYIVGWPSLVFGGATGIYAMRIVSALLSSAFLALAFLVAFGRRSTRWMPLGLAFVASPVVVYMAGSITPQGLEISSAVALWIGLLRLLQSYGPAEPDARPRALLWTVVTAAAVALANARATGPLWVVIVVLSCLAMVGWPATKRLFSRPRGYIGIGIIAAGGVFSLLWTLIGGSLSGQASAADAPLVGGSFVAGAWAMVRGTPTYIQQAAGVFGWLDTPLPPFVYAALYIALALPIVLAFTATGRRGLRTMAGLVALALLVPVVVQAYSVSQTGIIWQGRYGLYLYIAVPIVAGWLLSSRLGDRVAFLSTRITVVSVVLLAGYEIASFVLVLRRYVVGKGTLNDMVTHPQWQPPGGWMALVAVMVVVSLAYATWIIFLSSRAASVSQAERTAA